MSLCLFTEADLQQGRVTHEVQLDPGLNRTGDVWHILLPQLDASLLYGAAAGMHGRWQPHGQQAHGTDSGIECWGRGMVRRAAPRQGSSCLDGIRRRTLQHLQRGTATTR